MKTYRVETTTENITIYNCKNIEDAIDKALGYGFRQYEILNVCEDRR